jgi:hypothetical protein
MVIGVDCPSAVSVCGRVTTGVDDTKRSAMTGTTINRKRMRKKVRMMKFQNSTKRNAGRDC